ncbi:MAG: transcription antitermination factor NusB [Actinomycetes bacterium]|jgi:N utilization substance protein B|nr:MAG: transcription antitermination factor NusB [Actinomycetota bacterium]
MSVTLPGSLTVAELAGALEREVASVSAVLEELGEPSDPDDVVTGALAVRVAEILGIDAWVEPRDLALEYLYARETRGEPAMPEGRAGAIVDGVLTRLEDLDHRIESVSQHWTVARMPVIDRNVLRIGLWELECEPEVPTAVILAEAVRLASTFSTERSAAFVNGVLSSLARSVRG